MPSADLSVFCIRCVSPCPVLALGSLWVDRLKGYDGIAVTRLLCIQLI